MPLLFERELAGFAAQLLRGMKVPEPTARLVADSLLAANLRGVDSHGVQLLPYYLEQLECGDVNPVAEGHVVSECGSCESYSGDNGWGSASPNLDGSRHPAGPGTRHRAGGGA